MSLLSDRKIGGLQEFLPVLDAVAKSARPLLQHTACKLGHPLLYEGRRT